MARVYGDSTPFPYEVDYIELIDSAVDCAVALLMAQNDIARGQRDAVEAEARVRLQLKELGSLGKALETALASAVADVSEATQQVAQGLLQSGRQHIDGAFASLKHELERSKLGGSSQAESARRSGHRAVQAFLADHLPIGSHVSTRMSLSEERYVTHVRLATAFGLRAEFMADVPANHEWSRPRRVSDLASGSEVRLPQEAGWLSKRVELAPVKLDRFFIADVFANGRGGWIQLRRTPGGGPGLRLRLQLGDQPSVTAAAVAEDGSAPTTEPTQIEGEDCSRMLNLWRAIVESSADLVAFRRELRSATFGGQPLEKVEPSITARALIAYIAPLTVEISRRSGAVGELVLRKDVGNGRREESYLKHSELLKRIHTVPSQELRGYFDALRLTGVGQSQPVNAAAGVLEHPRAEESPGSQGPEPRRRAAPRSGAEGALERPDSSRPSIPPSPPPLEEPAAPPSTSGFFGKRPSEATPSSSEKVPQKRPSEAEATAAPRSR